MSKKSNVFNQAQYPTITKQKAIMSSGTVDPRKSGQESANRQAQGDRAF
jgi:hypothetical protein